MRFGAGEEESTKEALVKVMLAVGLATTVALTCNPSEEELPISDKDVQCAHYTQMYYPLLAKQTRTEGVVVIQAKLDDHGKVAEASAISGHDLLIPNAMANAKTWQFEPNSRHAAVLVYNFRIASGLCEGTSFRFEPPNFVTITACGVIASDLP